MIKLKRPETVKKALSAMALTVGLMAPAFAGSEANYSFTDGGSGGNTKKCYQTKVYTCSTSANVGYTFPNQGSVGYTTSGRGINCKAVRNGSPTCENKYCDGGTYTVSNSGCQ